MGRNVLWLVFLFLYHWCFWQEDLGVNLLLFSILAILYQKSSQGRLDLSPRESLYLLPLAFSAVGVLWVHSSWSIAVLLLSFAAYSGLLSNRQSSVLENFFSGLLSLASLRQPMLPQPLIREENRAFRGVLNVRILVAPLLIFALFFFLFTAGNPVFRQMNADFFSGFLRFMEHFS